MDSNVHFKRLSLNALYHSLDYKIDLLTISQDVLDRITITQFQNKLVPMTPQCMCGVVSGNVHNGEICFHCNTPVTEYLGTYKPVIWISAVGGRKFIAPQYWEMVNNVLKLGKFDSLAWLTNTRYKSNIEVPKILNCIVNDISGFTRSYSYVVKNLRKILDYLLNSQLLYSKRDRIRLLIHIYDNMTDTILSDYIPIPNKSLFLIEESAFSTKKTSLATGMVKSLALNYKDSIESGRDPDIVISRIMSELSNIYSSNADELLAGKKKIVRSSIFGTKVPGSFRTVMLPISGPHNYDDFIMPWIEAIICFRQLLINRLVIRKRKRYMDVCIQLDTALFNYDKEIDEELDDIMNDAKIMTDGRGIPISMSRNPSQYRGSLLLVYIIAIKKDPMDFTSEYGMIATSALSGDCEFSLI